MFFKYLYLLLVLIFLVSFLFTACSISNSPKYAVKNFINAVKNNDIDGLSETATAEIVAFYRTFGFLIQNVNIQMPEVKTVKEKINGSAAVVTVVFINDEEIEFDLVKKDDKWKVTLTVKIRQWLNKIWAG